MNEPFEYWWRTEGIFIPSCDKFDAYTLRWMKPIMQNIFENRNREVEKLENEIEKLEAIIFDIQHPKERS